MDVRIPGTENLTPEQHREEVESLHWSLMQHRIEKPITLTDWTHGFLAQAFRYANKETAAKIEQIKARCEKEPRR